MLRPTATTLACLLLFGAARLPLESHVEELVRDAGGRRGSSGLELRDELGQNGLLAVLGGFRSLVATILTIEATTARGNQRWGEVENRYGLATRLQPGIISYWRDGHFQTGYDAMNYYTHHADNADLTSEQRRPLLVHYARRAIRFLEDGLAANPRDPQLATTYALYCSNEAQRPFAYDPCRAARYYDIAAAPEDARPFYARFAAYNLAECEGYEAEAYRRLTALFHASERNHKPTLLRKLHHLEEVLSIPAAERLVPEPPAPPAGSDSSKKILR